jgi:hypothetical protein
MPVLRVVSSFFLAHVVIWRHVFLGRNLDVLLQLVRMLPASYAKWLHGAFSRSIMASMYSTMDLLAQSGHDGEIGAVSGQFSYVMPAFQ